MPGDSPRPYLWMLLGSVCFAGMGTLANAAGNYFPWPIIAMTRSIIPFALVIVWAIASGVQLVFWRPGVLWMRSISGSISLVCTFFALSKLPAPEVFTVTNMFPIWVALLSWPMLGEKPALSTWISVICGVAGVFVIHPPDFLFHSPTIHDWPILIAIVASISTAFAMLGLNRLKNIDTRAVVVHFSFTALIFAAAAYFFVERKTPEHAPNGWALLMVLGVGLSATVGQIFLTKAFTAGQAAKVSVVNLAQIPLTLILQLAFFDYQLDARKLCGMALVLAPTAWLMAHQKMRKMPPDLEPLAGAEE